MHPARRVAARAVIAIVILAMTAACTTTQGSDKTGGDTVVLTLATSDGQPPTPTSCTVPVQRCSSSSSARSPADASRSI